MKRRIRNILAVLLALAVLFVVIILSVMASDGTEHQDFAVLEEDVLPAQATESDQLAALAQAFGEKLPALPGAVHGRVYNARYQGKTARIAEIMIAQAQIRCVRPAACAPLIAPGGMPQMRADLSALSCPAVLSRDGGAFSLFFEDAQGAYCVSAALAEDEFLSLIQTLSWQY